MPKQWQSLILSFANSLYFRFMLFIKRHDTKEVCQVLKFLQEDETSSVWCCNWPGRHEIGKDCMLLVLSKEHNRIVEHIFCNPERTMKQVAHDLKLDYMPVYRLVKSLDIKVRWGYELRKITTGRSFRGKILTY
jgi:hypothetical protein